MWDVGQLPQPIPQPRDQLVRLVRKIQRFTDAPHVGEHADQVVRVQGDDGRPPGQR